MTYFLVIALIAFAIANVLDLYITARGIKQGGSEKSGLSVRVMVIRDSAIFAGVLTVGVIGAIYRNNPLTFLFGVVASVGAIKHALAARRWFAVGAKL